jgi:hypothetical protein
VVYPNLEELAKRSDIIVVGRTVGHRSQLTPDGKFITQDFLVRVQEVFKGDLPNRGSMLVSLPGGSYRFKDGTHVHVMAVGYKTPENGASYVFFLKQKTADYRGHTLASETQGLFALTKGNVVEPANPGPSDPMTLKYERMRTAAFLTKLHAAVQPQKKKK